MADQSQLLHESNFLRNNLKQYVIGNTYNGIQILVTGPAGFAVVRGVLIPSRVIGAGGSSEDAYRLEGNIAFTLTSGNNYSITIVGVTFKSINYQMCPFAANITDGAGYGQLQGGTSNIICFGRIAHSSASLSLNNELASWPTWADDII